MAKNIWSDVFLNTNVPATALRSGDSKRRTRESVRSPKRPANNARVHVGHVRRRLRHYYATDGIHDAVVLEIRDLPEGCRITVIEQTESANESSESEEPSSIELDESVRRIRAATREVVEGHCKTFRVLGMVHPIDLSDIFVDVELRRHRTANILVDPSNVQTEQEFDALEHIGERIDGRTAIASYLRVVVFGQAGSGKTTFLQRLAIECLENTFKATLIPFFVSLRHFARLPKTTLAAHVERGWSGDVATETLLRAGRLMLILDGLDEVESDSAINIRDEIEVFAHLYPRTSIVVSCRSAATQYVFQFFAEVEMAAFTEAQVHTFVARWFGARKQDDVILAFLLKLKSDPRIWKLASRPLLLTLLCLVWQRTGQFDGTQAGLYKRCVETLVWDWDVNRGLEQRLSYGLSGTELEGLLVKLAHYGLVAGKFLMPASETEHQVTKFFSKRTARPTAGFRARTVLNALESHFGIFMQYGDSYTFFHLTFQDYLAARHLSLKPNSLTEAARHILDPRWRSVWQFLMTMPNSSQAILMLAAKAGTYVEGKESIQSLLASISALPGKGRTRKRAALRALSLGFVLQRSSSAVGKRSTRWDYSALAKLIDPQSVAVELAIILTRLYDIALDVDFLFRSQDDGRKINLADSSPRLRDLTRGIAEELSKLAIITDGTQFTSSVQMLRSELLDINLWRRWHKTLKHGLELLIVTEWSGTLSPASLNSLDRYFDANLIVAECLSSASDLDEVGQARIAASMLLPA